MICKKNSADFRSGLEHHAFRIVRFMTICDWSFIKNPLCHDAVAVGFRANTIQFCTHVLGSKPAPFTTDQWLNIPFSETGTTLFDHLLGLKLTIHSWLSRVNEHYFTLDLLQFSHSNIESIRNDLDCLDQKLQIWCLACNDGQGWLFYETADEWVDVDGTFHPIESVSTLVRVLFCDTA